MSAAIASLSPSLFRPPAPVPHEAPLGLVRAIATLYRNPIEVWTRRHYEEKVLYAHTALGRNAAVCDPAGVRRIFLDNVANYRKDARQLRILQPALGRGLLTTDGEDWRAQRRSLAPLFSPRQVVAFAKPMAEVMRGDVERLARQRPGRIIDMHDHLARLALEVLEHTLFTQGLGQDASGFQQAVNRYFDTIGRVDPLDLFGVPQFVPRIGRARARQPLQWFRRTVDAIIAARRELLARGQTPPNDILTLLLKAQDPETGLAMSENDLRANITTFIGAGHETTANAMTWALYLISQSPEWRARAQAEADAELNAGPIETLAERTPVIRAIVEEAMRLYPPAAILSREAIADDEIAGQKIPAGTTVMVAPFLLHRHRKLWRDPDAFDPDRFFGENRERIDRFAYIPFGAGPRVCIGMGFAMQEMSIVLAHLLHAFRFDLARGHRVRPLQRVTLRPEGGMPMTLTPR